jgi:prepilin-type N-terminal cleavage/methylation domain-containing protein
MNAQRRQRGFSLLELVVVIILIALVVYAGLPALMGTIRQAHETAVRMNARALQEGVKRAKAMQMLDGLEGQVYDLPHFGDGTLDLSPAGFPAGTSRRRGDHLTARNCAEIWSAVLEPNPGDTRDAAGGDFDASLDTTGKTPICVYSYTHGGAMTISYDPATGSVWADAHFKRAGVFW